MKQINQTACLCFLPPFISHLPPASRVNSFGIRGAKKTGLASIRVGFPSESGETWAGVSCCAAKHQFPSYLCYTSANHLTQRLVQAAGASNTLPLPLHLPVLVSISGELRSCFMDGIHGGRSFLITAALHVLLGTDCTARHPRPSAKPSLFWAVRNPVLLKSAGRCRLVIQLTQWCTATSVTVFCFAFFSFIFLFRFLQQVEGGDACLFLFEKKKNKQTREQLWDKFSLGGFVLAKFYTAYISEQTPGALDCLLTSAWANFLLFWIGLYCLFCVILLKTNMSVCSRHIFFNKLWSEGSNW